MTTERDERDDLDKLKDALHQLHPGWKPVPQGGVFIVADENGNPQPQYRPSTPRGVLDQLQPEIRALMFKIPPAATDA